jgi:hypothetical protein
MAATTRTMEDASWDVPWRACPTVSDVAHRSGGVAVKVGTQGIGAEGSQHCCRN